MKKHFFAFMVLALGSLAHADICAYAPDVDLVKTNAALKNLTLMEDGLNGLRGKFVELGLDPSDNTSMNLTISDSGVYDQTAQTIKDVDLGKMFLVCKNGQLAFLAGAMKKSGIVCASKEYESNIPNSDVNLQCE